MHKSISRKTIVWLILGAVFVLLAAVLAWAVWSEIPAERTLKGISTDGIVVCYLSEADAAGIKDGMIVRCDEAEHEHEHEEGEVCMHETGVVTDAQASALSYDEVSAQLNGDESILQALDIGEQSIPVTMLVFGAPDGIIEVMVTLDPIHPIDLILK